MGRLSISLLSMAWLIKYSLQTRLAILNDIHLNLTYHMGCSFPHCYDDGQYSFDSPHSLMDLIIDDL